MPLINQILNMLVKGPLDSGPLLIYLQREITEGKR